MLSQRGRVRRVIVVGNGLAGMLAAIQLCESNVPVLMLSVGSARRAHSASARGGLSAAIEARGAGDSPLVHMEETLVAGDFLADQPPVRGMVEAAAGLVELADRIGVPFARTPEGAHVLGRSSGSLHRRAARSGATTGRQLAYALDEQLCRLESLDLVDEHGLGIAGEKALCRLELWDFLGLVRDDSGVAVGVVGQDLRSMRVKAFPGDAVCLATQGAGGLFGGSSQSLLAGAAAVAAAYRQGAIYANGEFVQSFPCAIAGADQPVLLAPGVLGEGGRLWVPKDKADKRRPNDIPEKERDYFLERAYPQFENHVADDVAARALLKVCVQEGRGAFDARRGQNAPEAYLDLTHLDRRQIARSLSGSLDLYARLGISGPVDEPLRVSPAVSHTLGGLWVDYEADPRGGLVAGSPRNHATSIAGLYAVGDAACQYHGAGSLGDNALLSALYAGTLAAEAMTTYRSALARSAFDLPGSIFEKAESVETARFDAILERNDNEKNRDNPYRLHAELGSALLADCSLERQDDRLDLLLDKLGEFEERAQRARVSDSALCLNQSAQFVRHFEDLLLIARVIVEGARLRAECRGTHYKPALDPERTPGSVGRDDDNWLRASLAAHEQRGSVKFVRQVDYECAGKRIHATDAVDTPYLAPRPRRYGPP